MKKVIVLIIIFFNNGFNIYSQDPLPLILQQNAIKVAPDFFSQNDNFFVLGEIKNNDENIFIAYNQHLWGNNRMTGRILIFNSRYELLGMYGTMNEVPRLVNKALVFPVLGELGNTIDFSSNIPPQVRIDGEIYKYESIY